MQTNAGGNPILPGDPLAVTLSNASAQKPTFTAPVAVGDLFFKLFVTDAPGLISDPDTVVIHLDREQRADGQRRRRADEQGDQLDRDADGCGSTDPDSDPLTYAVDAGRPDHERSAGSPATRPR